MEFLNKKIIEKVQDEDTLIVIIIGFASSAWSYFINIDYLVVLPPALAIVYLLGKVMSVFYEIRLKKIQLKKEKDNETNS